MQANILTQITKRNFHAFLSILVQNFFVGEKEKHEGRRVEVLIIDTTKINKIPFLFIANCYLRWELCSPTKVLMTHQILFFYCFFLSTSTRRHALVRKETKKKNSSILSGCFITVISCRSNTHLSFKSTEWLKWKSCVKI